jgi:hypothetical protein
MICVGNVYFIRITENASLDVPVGHRQEGREMVAIFGHVGFLLVGASYAAKDMLTLRILGLVAGLFLTAYNYFAPAQPLWLVIDWNLVFTAINVWGIVSHLRSRGAALQPAAVTA